MRALKMRSALASHWKLTMTNWEQSLKLILLQLHEKLLKNSTLTILWSFSIWSKLERWKSLISECLMSWLKVKKLSFLFLLTLILILMTLILCNNKEPFLVRIVMCEEKWILYDNQQWATQWLDWEEAPKHFPKPHLHQNGHGHCLVVCCPSWSTTAFWIPVKPLHLRRRFSKLMTCPQSFNACSRHWLIERAPFFSMVTPDRISHNQCFKSWMNWATKFCLICHTHLTSHQEAENAFQQYVESLSTDF